MNIDVYFIVYKFFRSEWGTLLVHKSHENEANIEVFIAL